MKPRLLDLFCGAGGAAKGYQRAGFYVIGVDIIPQPRYCGDEFIRADAMTYPLDGFDAIHASPPCQAYMRSGTVGKGRHPMLIPALRDRLSRFGAWVIENVPGAPLRPDIILCGSMFGLSVRRHRWFETKPRLAPFTLSCDHSRPIVGVYGHPHGKGGACRSMLPGNLKTWSQGLGIDWMESRELAQAIPPAYTQWVGAQLLKELKQMAA